MSKTESRDFWVCDEDLSYIKLGVTPEVKMYGSAHMRTPNKLTISWQVPDRVVSISESEFDKLAEDFYAEQMPIYSASDFYKKLREKLFREKG